MPYAVICTDHAGDAAQQLRSRELQAHLAYVADIADKVLVAGPMNIEGSSSYNASLFVYAVASENAARELLENDPYYQAGIYADVVYAPFTPARGTWL